MTVDEHNTKLREVIIKIEEIKNGGCTGTPEETSSCFQSIIEELKDCIFRDIILGITTQNLNHDNI